MSNRETIIIIAALVASVIAPTILGFFAAQGSRHAAAALRWMTTVLIVGVAVPGGLFWIANDQPNIWLANGIAALLFSLAASRLSYALRSRIGSQRFVGSVRVAFVGNMVASVLCAIGGFVYGGPVGVLGAIGAIFWFLLSSWLVQLLTRIQRAEPTTPR